MSEVADCKASADSASRKRCPSPEQDHAGEEVPSKTRKTNDEPEEPEATTENGKNTESDCKQADVNASTEKDAVESGSEATSSQTVQDSNADVQDDKSSDKPESSGAQKDPEKSPTPLHQLESAAIAAAEALASLTGGDEEQSQEAACSSEKGKHVKQTSKSKLRVSSKTQAAAADSSTSMHTTVSTKEDADDGEAEEEDDEEEEESVSVSSTTPSSSFASENEENDDGECAIVSVKMAPEMRQSVTLLAQVQMKLEALEKKSARLHQRLDVKINRLRRPHLDQRSSIAKNIPGFWVTALLNHPHLSAHIDETDEDALSYMTDLEIETFKNNKASPWNGRVSHVILEPHLWHRGHNLTTHSEPKKTGRGVYQTFFNWFSDHGNPAQDDVAQILKDDLFRDPLRYYLTPLWEPRENGSSASGTRAAGNGKDDGDECVVISDSDDEAGAEGSEAEGERSSSRGEEREEAEEEEEEEEVEGGEEEQEEQEEEINPGADESAAEEEDPGEIVIDGSDESDQEDS
ncbi:hypothetical protein WMY93_030992 [Mugilogobius chulae]|uniref:Uncharacterized protein n=1 Tax=Mugilogobius chulae TaxID=88201 RepID=A0AAW0MGT1_9GOBI